ncbi:protein-glutamine gamma-glutamyltransferase 4 [Bombina bombina]|uniref:protein-glutamine gamma-glutamyltransferase 4 n=1 Tax=Bombina bombina TaxID=8345 RepID=UPI00235AC5EA|nr:protein-glutamine gamma-glutamyltransferase 4 [Bombina bombina]
MNLRTISIDFLKCENERQHNTAEYDNHHLILRRGQGFMIKIIFNREITPKDSVKLQFTTGNRAKLANGTLILLELSPKGLTQHWSTTIRQCNGKEYLIAVHSPADAIIGKYTLSIITGKGIVYVPKDQTIYLLCNPWCKEDTVFMPNEDWRKEYVMNDTGYIYVGQSSRIVNRPWNFGQHEVDVLDCCMYLLDKSELKPAAKRDPVILSRKFSALVNSNDDKGILTGNWSGQYSGGVSPTTWTGSSAILQQYYKTKKPVNFGQCWVFSGVITTVMRCLGIPARSVTNFKSAHDTEENLKIDVYFNENGEKLDDWSSDSVWNFHVWNDAWMRRPDLPAGYDGWQAIDATPQELSQGIFQCGPCSLTAIKNGDVYLPYDAKFVFAEVNADRVHWMVKEDNGEEDVVQIKEEKTSIGKHISTKSVNNNLREDITSQYKYKEGSEDERKTFQNACSYLKSDTCLVYAAPPPPPPPGIKLNLIGDKDVLPGNPITLTISVENESSEAKTVNVVIGCQLQSYTGKVIANLASVTQTVEVAGNEAASIPLKVDAHDYMKSVTLFEDELIVLVNVISETKETQEKNSENLVIAFKYPPIIVDMPETGKIDEDFSCTFTFKNTLSIPLENCQLHVEGLGIFKLEKFDQGDIRPGGIFRSKIICAPKKTGEKKIVAELISTQVKGISAEKMITITK